jgi:hypothetical protein
MRKRRLFGLLIFAIPVVFAAATVAVAGDDGDNRFRARLSGYEEVPAISSTGTGTLTLQIQGETIAYTLNYSAIEGGAALASHIHFGQRSVNGGVIAFLCGGGGKPACTTPSGSFTGTITAADVIGPSGQGIEAGSFAEVVRALRAGFVYVNVHSTRWPGGEIRGQLSDRDNDQDDDDDEDDD